MKREAVNHTKMKRLCRKLSLPLWQGVGLMESIWHLTAREAPRGDLGKLSNEDIAIGIEYREDENVLVEALVASGWLDSDDEFRLVVHDWADHADDAVNLKLARAAEYFWNGKRPSMARMGEKERTKVEEGYSVRTKPESVRTASAQMRTASAPPSPPLPSQSLPEEENPCANAVAFSQVAPDPPPVREVLEKTAILHAATKVPAVVPKSIAHVDEISDWYHREFYPLYPRHKSRDEGLKAARARLKTKELRAKAMAALLEQLPELRARDPKRIPYPATWINSGAIDDEADPLFAPVREHQDRNERRRAEAITMQEMMRGTYDPARSVR